MHLSMADNALSEICDPYSQCNWPLETTDPMFGSPSGGVLRSRSNSHPYFIPLDSIDYSDAETYRDYCNTAETIQDADTNGIPSEEKQDASTGTTWEFVDQWTENSGTDVSDPQRMTCDYSGCGSVSFGTPCYFKDHLKFHFDKVLYEAIRTGVLKCTWNLDCEKKSPFNSSKSLQTHLGDIHINQLAWPKPYIPPRNYHEVEKHPENADSEDKTFELRRASTSTKLCEQTPQPSCSSNKSSLKAEHDKRQYEKMTTFDTTTSEKKASLFLDFQLSNHPKKKDTGGVKFSRDRNIGIENFSEPSNTRRWRKHWTGGGIFIEPPADPFYGR